MGKNHWTGQKGRGALPEITDRLMEVKIHRLVHVDRVEGRGSSGRMLAWHVPGPGWSGGACGVLSPERSEDALGI
jgi:hypothetical protein